METFQIFKLHHRGKDCVGVKLEREDSRNEAIKKIPGVRWSLTHRCWYGEYCLELEVLIRNVLGEKSIVSVRNIAVDEQVSDQTNTTNQLNSEKEIKIKKFSEWMHSRRYSEKSIKTYINAIKTCFRFFPEKAVENITNEDVIKFDNEYILKKQLSRSFQKQVVQALKRFYETIEKHDLDISQLHYPKGVFHLPNVLSKQEIKELLGCLTNLKHQAMLSLTYSCGLRVGELLSLVHSDIDSKRMVVLVRNGKGNRDRIVPLSPKILELLREYFSRYKPIKYLFEGAKPGEQYSSRSIQLVIKQAAEKAKISKPVTMHWLRHSFATHLHESGVDIRYIQELLGHKSTKTTQIYTHISTRSIQNIKSPFDDL